MNMLHATTFAALAEPTRLSIIELLARNQELSASEIGSKFSTSASAISQHLKVLREAGLVIVKKRAQQRMYQLDVATMLELEEWIYARTVRWNRPKQ
jgi:DNA-binding transcriptional ArsR family regulator